MKNDVKTELTASQDTIKKLIEFNDLQIGVNRNLITAVSKLQHEVKTLKDELQSIRTGANIN